MTVDECVIKFQGCFTGLAGGILDSALVIEKAEAGLSVQEKKTLRTKLDMSSAEFSKYLTIARCERRLRDLVEKLPPHLSTIHLIATLKGPKLDELVSSGLLNPLLSRRTLVRWIKENGAMRLYRNIYVDPSRPKEELRLVDELLAQVEALAWVGVRPA